MLNKKNINIPNILSFYRILSFPLVLFFALQKIENIFVIFLIINLITDILDGLIARMFNMKTDLGARLDSIADIGTYILAITGIYIFKSIDFSPYLLSFLIFVGLFVLCNLFSIAKFKRFPSLHLYSWKIGGYLQGFFFFSVFVFGFNIYFYYIAIIWGIVAFTEHLIIQTIIPQMISNAKGLYWILKNKK